MGSFDFIKNVGEKKIDVLLMNIRYLNNFSFPLALGDKYCCETNVSDICRSITEYLLN